MVLPELAKVLTEIQGVWSGMRSVKRGLNRRR